MGWRALAVLVIGVHAAWVLTVVFLGPFALKRPRLRVLHLAMMAATLAVSFGLGVCPLTPLENALRERAGMAGYPGGFIEHYLEELVYWDVPTGWLNTLTGVWLGLWGAAYWARRRRERRPS